MLLLLITAAVLSLKPLFTRAADAGYPLLKSGADFVLPVIAGIARFLFMPKSLRPDPAASSQGPGQGDLLSADHSQPGILEVIVMWGIKIIIALLIAIAAGIVIYNIFKWLFSRTTAGRDKKKIKNTPLWYTRLWAFIIFIYKIIIKSLKGYRKAADLYQRLLLWGHRSGISCFINETPLEFGARLNQNFPWLKNEIGIIINAFNDEAYGRNIPSPSTIKKAVLAWHKLRSLRNWPLRLKFLLFNRPGREL